MTRGFLAEGTSPIQAAAIVLIIAAKFALPLLIVRFPFAAGWANFVLDGVDGDLLVPLGLPNETYQPVDKITDWVTYVAIVVVAFRNAWPTRRLMLGLFLFRSVGQVGFLLTGNELLLAAFPNFLEPLFLVTASILAWERAVRHRPDWQERGFACSTGTAGHRHGHRRLQAPGRVLHARRQRRPQRALPAAVRRIGRAPPSPQPARWERTPLPVDPGGVSCVSTGPGAGRYFDGSRGVHHPRAEERGVPAPPVHWRGSSAGQSAGQASGVAVERSSAATAPGGRPGMPLADQRGHAGGVRRGHRRAADPDVAAAAADHGAVGGGEGLPGPGRVRARPAGEDAAAPEHAWPRVWGASPPGAVTSTGRADVRVAGERVDAGGRHGDDAGQLGRRDPAVVAHLAHDGGVGRPVRADRRRSRVAEVVGLVAGRGHDHHAPLLRVPGGVLQGLRIARCPASLAQKYR